MSSTSLSLVSAERLPAEPAYGQQELVAGPGLRVSRDVHRRRVDVADGPRDPAGECRRRLPSAVLLRRGAARRHSVRPHGGSFLVNIVMVTFATVTCLIVVSTAACLFALQ